MRKRIRRLPIILSLFCAPVLGAVCINIVVIASTADRIRTVSTLKPAQTVLLLGARVYADGRVSHIVRDRITTAVAVYQAGKAEKILVSGDHGTREYDEVNTIKTQLVQAGVPEQDIFMDHAGFSTYESVHRARSIFQVESLIVVTQEFHLPRALFIAAQFGIPAQGVIADRRRYRDAAYYAFREFLARVQDFFEAVVFRPDPTYLGEPIPITGDGQQTQD
ncbi:MAG TPA: hypothetical protein ENN69_06080 [Spirochaetia bacterium]|nr:hypothetical protein [Spirochaetia bacterium]